jgi:DNA repair photolyase
MDKIQTKPGKTNEGKPFDWWVQRQVKRGLWKLERISAALLGTPRDLEVYRASPAGPRISVFEAKAKAPDYCRECWADLRIGHGPCGLRCSACFLILTHRVKADPSRHVLYDNYADQEKAVRRWLRRSEAPPTLGLGIDSSDSLLYEGVTGTARRLIPLFADPQTNPNGRMLLLLTKSANVHYLKGLPTRNVVVSFSLNPQPVADIFEGKYPDDLRITPDISLRVAASEQARSMGFETRWRVDPIIPMEGWEDIYREWFREVSGARPARITLGLYREMNKLLPVFARKWGLEAMQWQSPWSLVPDGRHRQLPREVRIRIYRIMKVFIEKAWGPRAPVVSLCKERREVRQESGVNNLRCNCAL